ncbi:hypothetical protein [Kluyvera ascorbata]|uniref:hypothetical protein n=1 Tax=Kluyvera ascorbata TaxID=51288 RepID=UPI0039F675FA
MKFIRKLYMIIPSGSLTPFAIMMLDIPPAKVMIQLAVIKENDTKSTALYDMHNSPDK